MDPGEVFACIENFILNCDGFVAHNASFDLGMLEGNASRYNHTWSDKFKNTPWVCSKSDVPKHANNRCTRLSHLAVDYGLLVDGAKLHRAVDDVLLMGKMLAQTGMTFEEIYTWKQEPWVYIQATNVEKPWVDGGASVKKAKEEGFSWEKAYGTDGPVFQKSWVKRVKESEYQKELDGPSQFKRTRVA
jgi:DNA polymerase III epsilon subunit-like protein